MHYTLKSKVRIPKEDKTMFTVILLLGLGIALFLPKHEVEAPVVTTHGWGDR